MNDVYIYCLIDPRTDEIRYIGKTRNLKQRYYAHTHPYNSDGTYRNRWVAKLARLGYKPKMLVLEVVNDNNWEEKEKYWISFGKEYWRLTNISVGGGGSHTQTETQREKNTRALKNRVHTLQSRLKVSGERNVNAKLTPKEVNEIRQAYFSGNVSQRDLANIYGMGLSAIGSIIRYETWRQVETPLTLKQKIKRIRFHRENNKGENNPSAKLSYYKAEQIRDLHSRGTYPYDKLAAMYNVGKSTIARIITRKVWVK